MALTRSLSLAAYLALRRGGTDGENGGSAPPRPDGPLVWIHATTPGRVAAAAVLNARLASAALDASVLVTAPPGPVPAPEGLRLEAVPQDLRASARAFLDHWRPDLLVWLGGELRPALLSEAGEVRRILADVRGDEVGVEGGSWLPGLTGALLDGFVRGFAADAGAAARLRRAGMSADRIQVTGPLDAALPALPCSERDRADLAHALGTRPVWLAVGLPPDEVPAVAAAHRAAGGRTHRLLLIAVPRTAEEAEDIAHRLRREGLTVADRAQGEEPDDTVAAYIAEGPSELGLWYRLAPVTYLGGTLTGGGCRTPYEAAALGSALLHGPDTAPHGAEVARLQARGASRLVADVAGLGRQLEELLSPDRAAALAHAAWDEATRGAEAADRLFGLIRDSLDEVA
ncbi:3-deoxy-D-manno-octulosonic acid transferase [Wenxinia marina]|uniref:3-deoxy-D-manno-octulosonic acid transferase n=1 Tax=Wenxinia marina DSM 24838 TaxID=1123501 RepID=A0A0D0PIH4_9RHOB|nr:glycosyltransferase N-terminal domain-containing protein [Wenxinia marina]KIQ71161.1 3-deoxy-D-manno-octulosonic-acid transferase [Wenxinia marina DSM 24838]GGL54368.1 3-deoxy-D-manno-octulosonic acid transferase [Wenxinia marina]